MSNTKERGLLKNMYKIVDRRITFEEERVTVYDLQHNDGTIFENVSANRMEAERLAEYLSEKDVSPINLADVLVDGIDNEIGFDIYCN
jgi:hypothetical protein